MAFIGTIAVVCLVSMPIFIGLVPRSPLFLLGLPGLTALSGGIVPHAIFRSHIRKRLRDKLNEMGDFPCLSCGYNLKGNVSGVCPECGKPVVMT